MAPSFLTRRREALLSDVNTLGIQKALTGLSGPVEVQWVRLAMIVEAHKNESRAQSTNESSG